jgi:hypothetical protein
MKTLIENGDYEEIIDAYLLFENKVWQLKTVFQMIFTNMVGWSQRMFHNLKMFDDLKR